MMRGLNEHLARKANKEDGCTRRFWQGRFSSDPLLDESGLLACMAYVDLNPVRAGECDQLEEAEWTSIGERLKQAAKGELTTEPDDVDEFVETKSDDNQASNVSANLVPFADQVTESAQPSGNGAEAAGEIPGPSPEAVTPIPMRFVDYVELLDGTGRCQRDHGPSGVLNGPPPAILSRLKIRAEAWLDTMTTHGLRTRGALGREESLCAFAKKRGRKRVAGRGFANTLFDG